MKKKYILVLLIAFVTGVVLCSCGDSSTAEESRKENNEIVVGITQDLDDSLDPHLAVAAGTKEIMFNVFEGLLKPDPSGNLIPAIAESYSVSDDLLTYTFKPRSGVYFHNGEEVRPEDIIYSIERCAGMQNGQPLIAALSIISNVEEDYSGNIVITLSEPNNEFLSYMTLAIIPADYDQQSTAPVGTGPFKFVSRSAQESLVLEKFDDYWGTPAFIDKVTFKIIENSDSLMMSLKSGSIDICAHLESSQTAQLDGNFYVQESTMNLVQALYLNNAEEPFNNEMVRKALCYAVDVQSIIDIAFDGYGVKVGSSMYPAFSKYFDEELSDYYTYDVDMAKTMLAEAGYPDGFDMVITVPSNYQPHIDTATVIIEQLRQVGINASMELVEWDTWLSEVYSGRNFQATVVGIDASAMTARAMLERFVSGNSGNFINYSNQEYDDLFVEALSCTDDERQAEIYREMEKILTETAANVYIQDLADLIAIRQGITGLESYPIYVLDLSTVKYSE